jgi:hypothetical protein
MMTTGKKSTRFVLATLHIRQSSAVTFHKYRGLQLSSIWFAIAMSTSPLKTFSRKVDLLSIASTRGTARVFNRDPDEGNNDFHNDFAQFNTTDSSLGFDNFLFLNVIGIDQANCFLRLQEVSQVVNGVKVARPLSNFGFINVVYAPGTLENSPSSNSEKRSSSKNHIVFENCTILTAVNFLTTTVLGVDYPLHGYYDIAVRNSVFTKVDPNFSGGTWRDRSPESGWSFDNNHWLSSDSKIQCHRDEFY